MRKEATVVNRSIKAVFFDVDGTLFSHELNAVPDSTRRALAQLRKRGIQAVVATGRHMVEYSTLPVSDIDFDTPTRHWDGATYDSVSSSSENFATIFREILREAFNTKIDEGSESVFGMRYFAVVYKDEGDSNPITAHINEIDENSAFAYAEEAIKEGHEYGWMGNYR